MNRELIIRVRDHIAAHPERLEMEQWFSPHAASNWTTGRLYATPAKLLNEIFPFDPKLVLTDEWSCGSTACIAGTAVLLADDPDSLVGESDSEWESRDWAEAGRRALGLDSSLAHTLFLDWPTWTQASDEYGYTIAGEYYAELTQAEVAVVLLAMLLDGFDDLRFHDVEGPRRADRVAAAKGA